MVLDRLSEQLKDRNVRVEVPPDLPPVPMDMPLIVQALTNVVDNAAKYSPDGSPIDISDPAGWVRRTDRGCRPGRRHPS